MKKHILLLCYVMVLTSASALVSFDSLASSVEASDNTDKSQTTEVSKPVSNKGEVTSKSKTLALSPEMAQAIASSSSKQNANNTELAHSDGLTSSERIVKYIKSGFVHIVPMGIDHILFVLGLFLVAATMKQLFLQVTVFTLAHSVTLGLAASGYIGLSSDIVEPLIALSIAYIAYENIRNIDANSSRLWLIFAFGLLHGLGFAFVLQDFGIPCDAFLSALFAFNIGVELGQLSVIAVALALFYRWRTKPTYRYFVQIPISTFIGLIGIYWTIERVIL